jgi:serine/threonine protein kinase
VAAITVIAHERNHLTERFAREIKVLVELFHPGIVRYISHGVTSSGELFLAMELVDGEVLKTPCWLPMSSDRIAVAHTALR